MLAATVALDIGAKCDGFCFDSNKTVWMMDANCINSPTSVHYARVTATVEQFSYPFLSSMKRVLAPPSKPDAPAYRCH